MDDGEFEFVYHFNHLNPCFIRLFTETDRGLSLSIDVSYFQTILWKWKFSSSNCGLKITYIVWEWTSSLSGSVNRRINRELQRFLLSNMQGKKGSKRIEMIIKMVNEFKLTVVHFARPNPMQICGCAWIYRWTKETVENQDWATGPRGRRGPRAAGPSGRQAAGPSRAVGRGPRACF